MPASIWLVLHVGISMAALVRASALAIRPRLVEAPDVRLASESFVDLFEKVPCRRHLVDRLDALWQQPGTRGRLAKVGARLEDEASTVFGALLKTLRLKNLIELCDGTLEDLGCNDFWCASANFANHSASATGRFTCSNPAR